MKSYMKWGIGIGIATILFGIIITPIEARLFNQPLTWMFIKNFSEIAIFNFGLWLGFIIVKSRRTGFHLGRERSITSFSCSSADNIAGVKNT